MSDVAIRIVYPHQLFAAHLDAEDGTCFVLVEDDLMFRQYRFHSHKLVLHRASMAAFRDRLEDAGFETHLIRSDPQRSTLERLTAYLQDLRPDRVSLVDVVDDWLERDLRQALAGAGLEPRDEDVLESPGFLTTRAELREWFARHPARMQHFYSWQRRRLDILVDDGEPVGGRWSFDTENRKKLPRGHTPPPVAFPDRDRHVAEAIESVARDFSEAPGDPTAFSWPTTHAQAAAHLAHFVAERLELFGPYEDALSAEHRFVYHSLLTPMLNIGLLTPDQVIAAVLDAAEDHDVPIESLEGFVRQVIGWREYMRATYVLFGRRLRTSNRLAHTRSLGDGWWTATTGLDPVDRVIERVLDTGYAHHIERLMVLGNAMCLLRIEPDEVYEWFMELFIDAYDWVMVPNVYGMSQFAAGEAMTTKPYVSGSNYLRKMSDFPTGEWTEDWDALYWTFVRDHREVFEANYRSRRMPAMWDGFDEAKQQALLERARPWLDWHIA
ncbi:cryptochrome/photolyase family protein [Nostocoides sp. F2B08]|uniref:cryptochrome/photolyase family protein n=1 Tax=Nostocoides sp. F2B08 TaxID=2653936 RepID=UPI001263D3FC|nr:cryptochrome/photolyase family protein [Tetrasphaera sp. F2B08]KAB7745297.1 cryptochrome/photolyase family protein [Tetrasphaera sp. F2B08]